MATIKKPKKLKYPKKPKASASLATLENYVKRRNEIDKENRDRESAYKKAVLKRESLKKQIAKF